MKLQHLHNERIFMCWITAITDMYVPSIVDGMVKKGYAVGAANPNGELAMSVKDGLASVIALKIHSPSLDRAAADIYNDLMSILIEIKAYRYSVIITEWSDCIWVGTNIIIPLLPKAPTPPIPKPDKSNLN